MNTLSESEAWRGLPLQPVDREGLEALHQAVSMQNRDKIGQILQRPLPDDPWNSLSRLQSSFGPAFSRVITGLLKERQPLSLEDVYFRTMSRAVQHMKLDPASRGLALGHLVPGVRSALFSGGPRTVPEHFRRKDLTDIEGFMDDTYDDAYPLWRRILKNHLYEEVESPSVTFAAIHKDDELVAVAKSFPDFFGTHYVRRKFQGGYGLGSLVQGMALSGIPSSSPLYGHVAPDNPALNRHFRVNRGDNLSSTLGVALVRDRDSEGESEELLKTVIASHLCGFRTVHETRYPDAEIASWVQGAPVPDSISDRVRIYPAESLKGVALLDCLRGNFAEDYTLTRRTPDVWLFEDRQRTNDVRICWDPGEHQFEMSHFHPRRGSKT